LIIIFYFVTLLIRSKHEVNKNDNLRKIELSFQVEKVLDNNYVLKDHKNRIWGLMKGIIKKAGRKPKYN